MNISYGPPAHRGVTQLMAVGEAELEVGATDRAVKVTMYGSAAVALVGLLIGSSTIRNAGLAGYAALVIARQLAGTTPRVIPVSLDGGARRWTIG